MENPFKQFLPEESAMPPERQAEIMSNVHLKTYLAQILELFVGIFGMSMHHPTPPADRPPES